jgi:hypothetical protein
MYNFIRILRGYATSMMKRKTVNPVTNALGSYFNDLRLNTHNTATLRYAVIVYLITPFHTILSFILVVAFRTIR